MASEHVRVEQHAEVLVATVDRPEKKNALTDAMYGALADALEHAERDARVHVLLLRSEGPDYSAGNDLADFAAVARGDAPAVRQVSRFLAGLANAAKPIVAAVQGKAVGVGATMLLHCDQVVLAEDAVLTMPFVGLGLVPEAGSSLLLPARIGHARAFAIFTGEPVRAAEAFAWGLANRVVARNALDAEAMAAAERIAALTPGAVAATKKLMRNAAAISAAMDAENAEFAARLRSPEAAEAFRAFAERRRG